MLFYYAIFKINMEPVSTTDGNNNVANMRIMTSSNIDAVRLLILSKFLNHILDSSASDDSSNFTYEVACDGCNEYILHDNKLVCPSWTMICKHCRETKGKEYKIDLCQQCYLKHNYGTTGQYQCCLDNDNKFSESFMTFREKKDFYMANFKHCWVFQMEDHTLNLTMKCYQDGQLIATKENMPIFQETRGIYYYILGKLNHGHTFGLDDIEFQPQQSTDSSNQEKSKQA